MRFLLLMVLALSLTNGVAHAGYVSGNQLRAMCTDPARKEACAGYVVAIAESLDGFATHSPEVGDLGDACVQIPRAVSVEQLIAATNSFIARNPKLWQETGHVLVALAIQYAFPCTSKPAWIQITTKNAAR